MQKYLFITLTVHIIDEDFKLVSYVLDTQEIKERHTSENLLQHLQTVLNQYDIDVEKNHKITLNYNATNSNDIHEEDIECENEINFLNTESDHAELTINDDSRTKMDVPDLNVMQEENTQHSRQSGHFMQSTDIVYHDLTFTSDNAGDISKALKKLGKYRWFGCAGHHLNLIAQAGFKQVQSAASLVKKNAKKLLSTSNQVLQQVGGQFY